MCRKTKCFRFVSCPYLSFSLSPFASCVSVSLLRWLALSPLSLSLSLALALSLSLHSALLIHMYMFVNNRCAYTHKYGFVPSYMYIYSLTHARLPPTMRMDVHSCASTANLLCKYSQSLVQVQPIPLALTFFEAFPKLEGDGGGCGG